MRAWSALGHNDQLVLGILGLVVGIAAGYGALGFRLLIEAIQTIGFGSAGERLASVAGSLPWWQVVLVPTARGALIGWYTRRVMPGGRAQAVPEVIVAARRGGGRMPLAEGAGAAFGSALSIGAGASVGREGPIVHLGATLGAALAGRLGLAEQLRLTLLGCGVAAGIAASFNAPIAGAFFALEVVVGHYGLGAFAPVVLASVVGTVVTRIHLQDAPAFILPEQIVTSFLELPAFALLGVVAAATALGLMAGIGLVQTAHERLGLPGPLRPALAGLVTGVIAVRFPEVLGVGYEVSDQALRGAYPLLLLLALALAKAAATAVCLGRGFFGGIFSPSLCLGALVGAAFGVVAGHAFPDLASTPTIYAILGMGAVAASTLGAPLSTVLMIFELTGSYEVTFALMVSVAVASVLTRQMFGHSFFTWQLARRGIDHIDDRDLALLGQARVRDLMRAEGSRVTSGATLDDVKQRFRASHVTVFVEDDDGRLQGAITAEDLAEALAADAPLDTKASALAQRPTVVVLADDDLATALKRCAAQRARHVPVVDTLASLRLVGAVRYDDLLLAQNRALMRARAAERGET